MITGTSAFLVQHNHCNADRAISSENRSDTPVKRIWMRCAILTTFDALSTYLRSMWDQLSVPMMSSAGLHLAGRVTNQPVTPDVESHATA